MARPKSLVDKKPAPKESKPKKPKAPQPTTKTLVKEVIIPSNALYKCSKCGRVYSEQDKNFPPSYSHLFIGNNGRINWCNFCVEDMYNQFYSECKDAHETVRMLCRIFDWYFDNDAFDSAYSNFSKNKKNGLIFHYIKVLGLRKYEGKTYGHTVDDEIYLSAERYIEHVRESESAAIDDPVSFFGYGFKPEQYAYMTEQYIDWTARNECVTKTQEELFKTICIAQLNILEEQKRGGNVASAMKAFQDLLSSANLKPSQRDEKAIADQNTFGTLIKKWEDSDPIPEPDEAWKDVDGIGHYVRSWFLGHLCRMLGIKNTYSRESDEELEKYTVQPPEYNDDEESFEELFQVGDYDGKQR